MEGARGRLEGRTVGRASWEPLAEGGESGIFVFREPASQRCVGVLVLGEARTKNEKRRMRGGEQEVVVRKRTLNKVKEVDIKVLNGPEHVSAAACLPVTLRTFSSKVEGTAEVTKSLSKLESVDIFTYLGMLYLAKLR